MNKKLLTAAILASLTLSTAVAFAAAPTFSGDANIEYSNRDDSGSQLTNRIRLNIDSNIDQNLSLHGRVVMNNDLNSGNTATLVWGDNKTQLEQGYIGYKNGNTEIKAGRQPLFVGHGLLSDVNGIGGIKVNTSVEDVNLMGFYGKDAGMLKNDVGINVSAADISTKLGGVNVGASYLKKTDTFYGLNASAKVADGVVLNGEYVKNNDASNQNKGYWVEAKVGNAVKKGDFDYSLGYVNVEKNATPAGPINGNDYITEWNMAGGKGFRAKAHYAVTDNSTLTVYQDMFKDTVSDANKKRTDVEYEVRF